MAFYYNQTVFCAILSRLLLPLFYISDFKGKHASVMHRHARPAISHFGKKEVFVRGIVVATVFNI